MTVASEKGGVKMFRCRSLHATTQGPVYTSSSNQRGSSFPKVIGAMENHQTKSITGFFFLIRTLHAPFLIQMEFGRTKPPP